MAAMYAEVDTMSNQIVLFTTLQGITMQMLILRLIRVLSAQKRLSILTSTTLKVHMCCAVLCCANYIQWAGPNDGKSLTN